MKTMNLKLFLGAAAVVAGTMIAAATANAQEPDGYWNGEPIYRSSARGNGGILGDVDWGTFREGYVSLEGFGMFPSQKTHKNLPGHTPLGGVWSTVGMVRGGETFGWDFGGIFAVGGGTEEYCKRWASGRHEDYDVSQVDVLLGAQLGFAVAVDEHFRLALGVMGGLDFRTFEVDSGHHHHGHHHDDDDASGLGAFAGAYVRGDLKLTRRWALTASYRFMATWVDVDKMTAYNWVDEPFDVNPRTTNLYHGFTVGAKFCW